MKIPKIIYSTWISDKPLPDKFNKYIESWKLLLPDYEIRMITLENIPRNRFTDEFIRNKKFAVAAQYARAQRLYETGGIYFDIDVEVIKNFDELLDNEMFAGIESKADNNFINNAVLGAVKGHSFMLDYMDELDKVDLYKKDIEVSTGPLMVTGLMKQRGWIPENKNIQLNGIQIFCSEYFYPYCPDEQFKPNCIKQNTYAVHHWAATWKNSVSIIIHSCYQTELLFETIKCAQGQSQKAIEIIVMSDETASHSKQIKVEAEKHKVKLIETNYSCSSTVKNTGVDFAKGKWILLLKSGDIINAAFIAKTIDKGDIVGIHQNVHINHDCKNPTSANGCFLFRKEVWERINGYDNTMTDGIADEDFIKRAESEGFIVKFVMNE